MNMYSWGGLVLFLSLGAHAEHVRQLEDVLRGELDMLLQEFKFPGATAAFVLADGSFGEVAVGMADRESGQRMTPESGLLAASIGKTFVSATALALAAEGKLDLEAPIATWLGDRPWFSRLPQGDRITVRQLLTHRSGLPDHVKQASFARDLRESWADGGPSFAPEALIGFILDQPPHFPPGEGWAYSDTGYVLLGLILEQICERPLYEEVEDRFLLPLHLTRTRPSNQRVLPGLVPGYTSPENSFGFPEKSTGPDGQLRWDPGLEHFGGGWMSSSGDLARWGAALYNGAALPAAAREDLRRTLPTAEMPGAPHYGPGVSHHPHGPLGPTYGHGGWIPGYVSSLRHYSQHGLTVAFQVNTDNIAEAGNWRMEMELRLAAALHASPHFKEGARHE